MKSSFKKDQSKLRYLISMWRKESHAIHQYVKADNKYMKNVIRIGNVGKVPSEFKQNLKWF